MESNGRLNLSNMVIFISIVGLITVVSWVSLALRRFVRN